MSISYEDALETLCAMFQNWDRSFSSSSLPLSSRRLIIYDRETIIAIFESNGYHVERTIETILSMEQPDSVRSEENQIISSR
jgi:hypothetical protein